MRLVVFVFSILFFGQIHAQTEYFPSIHQEQLEHYNQLGNATADYYESTTVPSTKKFVSEKSNCELEKVVYGWHPYWSGNAYQNYDWNLLSHFSFFSYEVNPSTGGPITTHGFQTSAAVDAALASGNTKVTLTVTLFSNHATFFNSSTAPQNLIDNLISLVQSRGIHGVNIDIEGLPSAYKTHFTNFMINLANQMHAAIPNSEVSTVLYAVDWNNVFDFSQMGAVVDHFVVMGYGYYWSGSSSTGPNDPLYHFGTNYNYNLSKTITYYLNKGCPREKLVMGLPYYGRNWSTTSLVIPSTTTGSSSAPAYNTVKNNSTGNYSPANHHYDYDSFTDVYAYMSGGEPRQCFITLEDGFKKRLDHIRNTGIGGIGIWALGYDDGYTELWEAIEEYFTDCFSSPCEGTIHDFGGPTKNYYDNENYTWTIAPENAESIQLTFTSFDVENNYDFLHIYDGNSTSAPEIAGSPFTGTVLPPQINSSTGALTFKFTSDGATTKPGFVADYVCIQDATPPITSISSDEDWVTENFDVTITDEDNEGGSGIQDGYYQTSDFNGTEWRANSINGFFTDFFEDEIHTDWTEIEGQWEINAGKLLQVSESVNNTNIYAALNQNLSDSYLYHFKAAIDGTGTNRRGGFHFFCDDGTAENRGNSYFVFFRLDGSQFLQIYKVIEDDFGSPVVNMPFSTTPGQLYDYKIVYNPNDGKISVFRDDNFVVSWQDSEPYITGDFISFRTGNASMEIESLEVYRSRENTVEITVGEQANADFRYQNYNPTTPSGKVKSITRDNVNNLSVIVEDLYDVDWSAPLNFTVNDGTAEDIDTVFLSEDNLILSANWELATDSHSGIKEYWFAIGTTAGDNDILDWTNNQLSTQTTQSNLPLEDSTKYFFSIKAINNAELITEISSDGQVVVFEIEDEEEGDEDEDEDEEEEEEDPEDEDDEDDDTSDISLVEEGTSKLLLYPNPAQGEIYIESSKTIRAIQVKNAIGQQVVSNYNSTTNSLDTKELSSGIYFVTIQFSDNQRETVKIIKK